MLAFYPEFEADAVVSSEVILLLDLSNSMKVHQTHTHTHTHTQHTHSILVQTVHSSPSSQGASLTSAKKVLLLLLHHLPHKCLFNVVVFGATHTELFPSSQPKTKDTLSSAITFVQVGRQATGRGCNVVLVEVVMRD